MRKRDDFKEISIKIAKNMAMIFVDVLAMIIAAVIIIGFFFYYMTPLDPKQLTEGVAQTSIIYDRTGEHVLYEIHGEENRKIIPRSEIPKSLRLATIASEDDRFYKHAGIDFQAIARATHADLRSNEMEQGGSTITQQLARNAFLSRDKTFRRKILEIILALKIERKYDKEQILDMYLNEIPYGSNTYGIQSAAETFFGRNARELTLDETATLAALPKAPTYLSPYGNHTDKLIERRNWIINRMTELEYITQDEADFAKNVDTLEKIIPFHQSIEAPHFVFYVKEILEQKYGKDMVEKGGFKVITTLDWEKQKMAEETIAKHADNIRSKYKSSNASLVAIDPKTGEILAMVGSKNYWDKSIDGQVNVSISPRQPGSSFKPFAYAAAFEKGYQPENLIFDTPTNFGPDGSGKPYIPHNYDGRFHGLVSMRQALAMSLNIPAVKTLYLAGINETIDLAHRLGITTLNERNRYGLALVLGGGEVSLLDETAGFSVFANDGNKNPPVAIAQVIDNHGKIYYAAHKQEVQVLDPQIARKINSILSDNNARTPIFGSGNKLHIPGRAVAAKTGTTQDFHDAWTVGYAPSLAVGVWAGNNNNAPMAPGADGSYVAAPIWHDFMVRALESYPPENFTDYDRIASKNMIDFSNMAKIKYYDLETGDKISEKEKDEMDPKQVGVRVTYPGLPSGSMPLIVEMSNYTDKMLEKWRSSIKFSTEDEPKDKKKKKK